MFFDLNEWHIQKRSGEIIVDFMGEITPDVIALNLFSIEKHIDLSQISHATQKKIFNVVVESFQNLYHHSDNPIREDNQEQKEKFGVLILVREGTFFRLSLGNYIKSEKQLMLKDRIDQLNSLSDEEIRQLYKDILSNDEYSLKGGGGLGMLDIVRKTGNKLEYNFYPVGNNQMFFSMDVYIS